MTLGIIFFLFFSPEKMTLSNYFGLIAKISGHRPSQGIRGICKIKIENRFIFLNAFSKKFFILIGISYPKGEPILPHLLRYSPFAVDDHSFMG